MKTPLNCFTLLVVAIAPVITAARAEPTVDVIVALAPEIFSQEDPEQISADLAGRAAAAMSVSGLASKQFRFRPYLISADYPYELTGTSKQANDFITDIDDPFLGIARETGDLVYPADVEAFDLVLLVVGDLRDNDKPNVRVCGAAEVIYDDDGTIQFGLDPVNPTARNKKFSSVINWHIDCLGKRSFILAHELGHNFGGDHQFLRAGESCPEDIGDCLPNWPVNYNHPAIYYDANGSVAKSTIMGGSASYPMVLRYSTSELGETIPGGYPAGSADKDMVRVINTTWDDVAAYRPLPPPTLSHCAEQIVFCNVNTATYAITPYINEPYAITNIHLDTRRTTAQLWSPQYDGPFACPTHGDFRTFLYQILIDTAYGSTSCSGQIYIDLVDACQQEPW